MRKPVAAIAVLTGLGLAGAGLVTPTVADESPTPRVMAANVSSPEMSSRLAAQATEYWTPERMAAAVPATSEPAVRQRPAARGVVNEQVEVDGTPSFVPPAAGSFETTHAAARAADVTADRLYAKPKKGKKRKPWKAIAVKRPYKSFSARTVVKFFYVMEGVPMVCSGTVVNSRSKSMVSTAGHCVSNGAGVWNTKMVVVPAYSSSGRRSGNAPYGVWPAKTATTTSEYFAYGNMLHDLGYVVVKPLRGKKIVQRVGGQGIGWNLPRNKPFTALGYPSDKPFDGMSQYRCGPRKKKTNDNPYEGLPEWPGPSTMGIRCNMTAGTSGAGWLTKMKQGKKRKVVVVNSLHSYSYETGPKRSKKVRYGPYFGDGAKELFRYTSKIR